MIVVHHLNNSRSQRVLWLLEELGVPYEVKRYQRDAKTMLAPPDLLAVHPLGKSPVITDGDKTLAETGAIVDYLLETYGQGRLIPAAGTPERLAYTYWLHYAEGSAMTPLLLKLVFTALPARAPGLLKGLVKSIAGRAQSGFVDPQLKLHIDHWDAALAKTAWFAGPDFTAADIMMSFPLETGAARAGAGSRPRIKAFLGRIHVRPAYLRALERGGPYNYA
ncbi:glutathione S-transferase [Caulobacter sp. Root1455]|uniref:glutathione S-transferase family protein n=1 Tax=Caulobacter sp. Root1455 TaxID=1736465 RepID=UPI0006F9D842|nr:glutathione S-transferase [Caulobacter sp. Root1455]KQZ06245.1 glutathione S-transferase [Caulobacter sp. Root1455]